MGDIADMNDIERFLRTTIGRAYLEETRQMLLGRTITEVDFSNEVYHIATTLHLDNGETFFLSQSSLEVEVIRGQFEEVLEREYYVDFPERKPAEDASL
jgi:hypothetical protein